MAYSKVHSRHELGNIVFYDGQYRQRWLDVIGPNAVKFLEDFAGDIPGVATAGTWIATAVGTSGIASYNAEGGCILLWGAGNNNDGVQIQKLAGFKAIDDCPIYFGVRWQITGTTGAGSCSILMGLHDEDTSLCGGNGDGMYFYSGSASTSLEFVLSESNTETDVTALATIAVDTWYEDELYWDGSNTIKAWHDGAYIGSGSSASMGQDVQLAVSLAYLDEVGHASSGVGLVVDWVRTIQLLDVRNV